MEETGLAQSAEPPVPVQGDGTPDMVRAECISDGQPGVHQQQQVEQETATDSLQSSLEAALAVTAEHMIVYFDLESLGRLGQVSKSVYECTRSKRYKMHVLINQYCQVRSKHVSGLPAASQPAGFDKWTLNQSFIFKRLFYPEDHSNDTIKSSIAKHWRVSGTRAIQRLVHRAQSEGWVDLKVMCYSLARWAVKHNYNLILDVVLLARVSYQRDSEIESDSDSDTDDQMIYDFGSGPLVLAPNEVWHVLQSAIAENNFDAVQAILVCDADSPAEDRRLSGAMIVDAVRTAAFGGNSRVFAGLFSHANSYFRDFVEPCIFEALRVAADAMQCEFAANMANMLMMRLSRMQAALPDSSLGTDQVETMVNAVNVQRNLVREALKSALTSYARCKSDAGTIEIGGHSFRPIHLDLPVKESHALAAAGTKSLVETEGFRELVGSADVEHASLEPALRNGISEIAVLLNTKGLLGQNALARYLDDAVRRGFVESASVLLAIPGAFQSHYLEHLRSEAYLREKDDIVAVLDQALARF